VPYFPEQVLEALKDVSPILAGAGRRSLLAYKNMPSYLV
jgi:hypothetical protein